MIDPKELIGKTLAEARKLYCKIRVTKAGPVGFAVTADYRTDRINVTLKEDSLEFIKVKTMIGDTEYTFEEVKDENMDAGIIETAHIG